MITMLITENRNNTFKINLNIEEEYKIDIMHHFTLTEVNTFTDELINMMYNDFFFSYNFNDVRNKVNEIDIDLCYNINNSLYITKDVKFFERKIHYTRDTILYSHIKDIDTMIIVINAIMQLVAY